MNEEKQAELYTAPGGKFVRSDSLRRMLPLVFVSALAKASPLHKVRWRAVRG